MIIIKIVIFSQKWILFLINFRLKKIITTLPFSIHILFCILIPKANKIITIASQISKLGASKVPEDPECMITLPT